MKKILLLTKLLLLSLITFSCYNEDNTFGETLVSSAFRNISTDTCTVTITSTIIDSLETNNKAVALVGQYTHDLWGSVSVNSFIPYQAPAYSIDMDETVRLDSLVLALGYSGYSIGDTMQHLSFTIHRLKEKIIQNDNGYLYNNSSFAYDEEAIAGYTIRPRPNDEERFEVRLPDELGQDLLNRLHQRDDVVSDDYFEDYFNGLVIKPADLCQNLISFAVGDTSAAMILYYHVEGELAESHVCIIYPNEENQFYQIQHDRTGTALAGIPLKNVELTSEEMDNRGLLFSGLGWYSRLGFPHLNSIMQQGERVSIESAYLKIYPETGTYSDYNPLPDSIYLYIIDENNVVTDAVTDYLGEAVQSGSLVVDDTFHENTYYYFDISTFIKEELGAFGFYKHNLQLVFTDDTYTKTLRNLTFSDQQGRNPISLQLTYKIYESY